MRLASTAQYRIGFLTGVTAMRPASSSSTCCASAEVNLATRVSQRMPLAVC